MSIYEKIEALVNSKSTEKMKFYKAVNLTHSGFKFMMENKSLKLDTLEKISEYFNKPIAYFLSIDSTTDSEIQELQKKYYNLLEKYNLCLEINKKMYALKHTGAQMYLENNEVIDLPWLQRQMEHSSIKETETYVSKRKLKMIDQNSLNLPNY